MPPAFAAVYRGVSFAPVNCDGDHGQMKDHGRGNDDGHGNDNGHGDDDHEHSQDDVCGPTRIAAGH